MQEKDVVVEAYKIVENSSKAPDASEERDGLQYQKSFDFSNSAEDLSITFRGIKGERNLVSDYQRKRIGTEFCPSSNAR